MNKDLVLFETEPGVSHPARVWFAASGDLDGYCGPYSGPPIGAAAAEWDVSIAYRQAWARGRALLAGEVDPRLLVTPRYRFQHQAPSGPLGPQRPSRLVYWNTGLRTTTIRMGKDGQQIEEPAPALRHARDLPRAPFYALPKKLPGETVCRIAWMSSEELVDVRVRPDDESEFTSIVELVCRRPQWMIALHLFFWIVDPAEL
jgi:hypothetical protein